MKQNIMSEFCEIRWIASGLRDVSGAAIELVNKLGLPTNKVLVNANFSKIPTSTPFGTRHLALQIVKLYEDVVLNQDSQQT
jgi:hypothetical protein